MTNRWRFVRAATPALIAIAGAATLIGVPGAFQRSDSSITSLPPSTTAPEAMPLPAPSLHTASAATEAARKTARTRTPDATAAGSVDAPWPPAVEPTRHLDEVPHTDAVPRAKLRLPANSVPNAKPAPAADTRSIAALTPRGTPLTGTDVTNGEAATISGCLQAGDDSFWLKDASGADAPKSRSWKSGFLKKHAQPVQVVTATRTLQLSNYIGQRVTATGTLAKRTMHARSLERMAGSCR